MKRSVRLEQVVDLPHRERARFHRGVLLALTFIAVAGLALVVGAAASRHAEFIPVVVVLAIIPLLGGLVGLWRLIAAWEADLTRSHAVLAAFALALVCWALSTLVYLIERARGAPLLEFPSLIDVPNYLSVLCWTVGVWLLYEDGVDDFLEEVSKNSYFLTLLAVLVFFVLTIAEGSDYGKLLWSGDNLAKHVTEAFLPLAEGVNGFLLFRATRGRLGKRLRHDRTALRALAFGLLLTAAADLLFVAGVSIGARDPSNPLAYRNGGLADALTLVSYFWLAFGLLHFPLDAPLFHPRDTSQAGSELDSIRA